MFCSTCGTQNAGSSFCTNCGAALNVAAQPAGQPAARPVSNSNVLSTMAIIFGTISFLLLPILFGLAGVILAVIAKSKNEQKATAAIIVASLGLVLGMIFGAIVGASSF